jgi:hypothetical protein
MSDEVEQLAITVGGAVLSTATIDSLMTAVFPTRTSDLVGTPTYTWIGVGPPVLAATWPAATSDQGKCVQLLARFEVHSVLPSIAGP